MKQDTRLTAAERAAMEARVKALRTEAAALAKTLKKDEATPVEKVEVTEKVTETPVEEAEVTEEVTETPVEEAEVTEEVTETPVEEEEVTEEVTETSEEEDAADDQKENDDKTVGFAKFFKWLLGIVGVGALVGILIMLMVMNFSKDNNQSSDDGIVNPDNGVVDTTPNGDNVPDTDVPVETDVLVDTDTPADTDVPVDTDTPADTDVPADTDTSVEPEFDIDAFTVSVQNIANTLTTDENIATNVDIFVEKIGVDKLEKLVEKNGELSVQKAIAEFLAFVPEIKMDQYIRNNGLDYNPNAMNDWYDKLDAASDAYKEATGKNPEGAFMSLEGYDTHKNNREAMKALIIESGDMALLTWYEAKTAGYDVMVQQQSDTKMADEYKEEVKLELVNNVNGSIKLIELQLEKNINGTNADTLDYAEAYEEFIINNYMYVVAN